MKTLYSESRASFSVGILVWMLTLVLLVLLLTIALPYGKVFPSADEWTYLQPDAGSLRWFFAQHVDHRIPIQKAIQLAALHVSHFDFRALLAINFANAALGAALFIAAAQLYRGRASIGDIVIPLCLLSFGAGYAQWGFEFQFLSSLVFTSGFVLAVVKYGRTERHIYLWAAFAALFLCSWCGINGVVVSTTISVMLVGFMFVQRQFPGVVASMALGLTIVTNILLWLLWAPSGASAGQLDLVRAVHFALSMIGSPLLVYFSPHSELKIIIISVLIIAGITASLARLRDGRLTDFAIFAALVANGVLIVATAYGRSKLMPWQPGHEGHYGALAMPMLVIAWIAFSSAVGRKKVEIGTGVALVLLFALAYKANYIWRVDSDSSQRADRMAARMAIAGPDEAERVAAKYIRLYFATDTDQTRQAWMIMYVASGIPVLRRHEHYGIGLFSKRAQIRHGAPNGLPVTEVETCEGSIDHVNYEAPLPSIKITDFVSLDGWMTLVGKDGSTPDAVYVTLANDDGHMIYANTEKASRSDVKAHYGTPKMDNAGFASIIDTSSLEKKMTLGLARQVGERIERCRNFQVLLYRGEAPAAVPTQQR